MIEKGACILVSTVCTLAANHIQLPRVGADRTYACIVRPSSYNTVTGKPVLGYKHTTIASKHRLFLAYTLINQLHYHYPALLLYMLYSSQLKPIKSMPILISSM